MDRRHRPDRSLHPQDKHRLAAAHQLVRISDEGAFAQIVAEDSSGNLPPKVREYVSGVTRWRRWLDHLIDRRYTGEAESFDALVREIARIGAYDLVILGTPPHVAVSAAVAVARETAAKGADRLINAVLRRIAEEGREPSVESTGEPHDDLAIRWSHPTWMVRRWVDRFGEADTVALMKHNNDRPWYGIRSSPFVAVPRAVHEIVGQLGMQSRDTPLPEFVMVDRLGPLVREGLIEDGTVAVQDVAAAMAVRLLDPQPGETIIDACAAPGGKSTYAAIRMNNEGRIVAVDRNRSRLRMLKRSAGRQRIKIIDTVEADFAALNSELLPRADRILIDAPCSGLGVLARRPDLRWRKTEADVEALLHVQDRLLDRAATLAVPGGLIVYSTCTTTVEENSGTVERFLDRHEEFSVEPAGDLLPGEYLNEAGALETLPHVHGIDGAFAVRLRRRS